MTNRVAKNSITISRETIEKRRGIVILPLREYRKLCERAVPTYYLKGKAARKLDKLVEEKIDKIENRDVSEEKNRKNRDVSEKIGTFLNFAGLVRLMC